VSRYEVIGGAFVFAGMVILYFAVGWLPMLGAWWLVAGHIILHHAGNGEA